MSELFDGDEDVIEINDEFEEVNVDLNATEKVDVDARRRLENLLEEKRLSKELDDFSDY